MAKLRLLLINDNSAHNNWGAQITPRAMERVFQYVLPDVEWEWLSHAWLRHEYVRMRLPFGTGPLYRVGSLPRINLLVRRFSQPMGFFPAVADDFDWFARRWVDGRGGPPARRFLELARWADVVVHNGENSVYRNTTEACRATFLLYVAKTVLDTPACAVNVTAELNDVRPVLPAMVRKTYPMLDLVSTREPRSLRNLRDSGVPNATPGADIVFGLEPPETTAGFARWKEAEGPSGPYVCLSASALPVSAPRQGRDGEMAELVRKIQKLGMECVLVAKDKHNQFLREVAHRTGARFFGPEHTFEDLWPLFRDATLLITGHFHYAVAASMVGCPFVPLSTNNHKMAGLCELVGIPRKEPFDITDLARCGDELVAFSETLIGRSAELRPALLDRSGRLREDVLRMARQVGRLSASAEGAGSG